SAQVSIGEVDPSIWSSTSAPCAAPDESRLWPNHRMAPSHDVQPFRQRADVSVSVPEISQCYVGPVLPAGRHQPLAGVARVAVDKWIVVGKDRRPSVESSLMRSYYITERGAFIEYVVPRQRKSACFGPVFEEEIGNHPRPVFEFGRMRWRILAIGPNQV